MTTLMIDESGPAKPVNGGMSLASEVGKVLDFFRPVPMADALAKRDERRAWITGLVEAHCKRLPLKPAQTAACVDLALAVWNYGRGSSAERAVSEGKLTANRIAHEVGGQGPRAA